MGWWVREGGVGVGGGGGWCAARLTCRHVRFVCLSDRLEENVKDTCCQGQSQAHNALL